MALTVNGIPITPAQLATLQADLGIVVAEEVTNRFTTLEGTDDAIFLRAGTPGLASASVIAAFTGGGSGTQTLTPTRLNNTNTFFSPTVSLGGGGSVAFVAAGSPYNTISQLTAHSIPVPAGLAVGDLVTVLIGDFADATSITTNTGQNFTRQVRQVGAIWSLVISGSVPTSITVNYTTASDLSAQAIAFRGATTLAGTPINDEAFSARATIPYITDNASAAVVCVYVRAHPNSATAAQFNGANAANHLYKVEFTPVGWFAGIHAGPTGSNNIDMTWSAADTGGRYLVAAFRP